MRVDSSREKGAFWLTGSQVFRLMNNVTRGLNEIYRRIFRGSMPELYADESIDWEIYYRSYVDTYLQRDIRNLAQVADEMQFYNFMTIVAAHTSKPVVYAAIL